MDALEIRKLSYSRNPWRILLDGNEINFADSMCLPFSFARKRDAVQVLEALLAIGDWSKCHEFTAEQKSRFVEVARQTESFRGFKALMERAA